MRRKMMGARRRIVLLLPILAVAVGAFGIGALVSGKLLWRDRGGVAIAESIPPAAAGSGGVRRNRRTGWGGDQGARRQAAVRALGFLAR